MSYGNGDVQWMRAGRGVIHEEMWDLSEAEWAHRRIEIFQLWVNLPKSSKGLEPSLHLLKDRDIPNIDCGNGVSVKIICGSLFDVRNPSSSSTSSSSAIPKIFPLTKDSLSGTKVGVEGENAAHQDIEENQVETENELPGIRGPGSTISESSVSILHLNMAKGDTSVNFNIDSDCTTTVYVRRGSLKVQGTTTGTEGVLVESEIRSGDCVIYRMAPQMRRGGKGQEEGLGLGVLTLLSGPDGLGKNQTY